MKSAVASPVYRVLSTADTRGTLTFEQVYAQRFRDVSRWVRALGGSDADLDDLTQEVFVVVERRLPDFDGRNLGAWLYKIAKHQVSDYRRRAWVRRLFNRPGLDADASELSTPTSSQPSPDEVMEQREIQGFLSRIFDKMSLTQRSAFILFEIEGYSGEEIAELEGIPVNTVWSRLYHARRSFFELVDQARADGRLP
jgi:RNA polymerase sigma-70 factor (ECF subfamily)